VLCPFGKEGFPKTGAGFLKKRKKKGRVTGGKKCGLKTPFGDGEGRDFGNQKKGRG